MLLVGTGLYATLVGVRSEFEQFGTAAIGLIGAAYYAGFVAGSRLTLRIVGTVGHIRVYAALCSTLAAAALASGVLVSPVSWLAFRFIAGAAIAGVYVVAESWLNQLASNSNRARILSTYAMVTIITYGGGQLLLTVFDPLGLTAFCVAAIAITVAVSPVALSAGANPPVVEPPKHLSLGQMFSLAPTGVVTAFGTGAVMGAVTAFAPIYAARSSMDVARIGVFTAMPAVGSLLLQVPIASLSDRLDRRKVGVVSALVAAASTILLYVSGPNTPVGFFSMVLLGGTMYPLYSIAGAYTNDRLEPSLLTAAAAQLVVLFGIGAFIGPILMSIAMSAFGNDAYPISAAVALVAVALFLAVRIAQHPSAERALPEHDLALDTQALYVPATAVAMGRRLRPGRVHTTTESDIDVPSP